MTQCPRSRLACRSLAVAALAGLSRGGERRTGFLLPQEGHGGPVSPARGDAIWLIRLPGLRRLFGMTGLRREGGQQDLSQGDSAVAGRYLPVQIHGKASLPEPMVHKPG